MISEKAGRWTVQMASVTFVHCAGDCARHSPLSTRPSSRELEREKRAGALCNPSYPIPLPPCHALIWQWLGYSLDGWASCRVVLEPRPRSLLASRETTSPTTLAGLRVRRKSPFHFGSHNYSHMFEGSLKCYLLPAKTLTDTNTNDRWKAEETLIYSGWKKI